MFEDRVARGAELLDQLEPDWRDKIDQDELNLASRSRCVLGQVFGDYDRGLAETGLTDDEAPAHGFGLPGDDITGTYRQLTRAWLDHLNAS